MLLLTSEITMFCFVLTVVTSHCKRTEPDIPTRHIFIHITFLFRARLQVSMSPFSYDVMHPKPQSSVRYEWTKHILVWSWKISYVCQTIV